jgi:hypothetical protein
MLTLTIGVLQGLDRTDLRAVVHAVSRAGGGISGLEELCVPSFIACRLLADLAVPSGLARVPDVEP